MGVATGAFVMRTFFPKPPQEESELDILGRALQERGIALPCETTPSEELNREEL